MLLIFSYKIDTALWELGNTGYCFVNCPIIYVQIYHSIGPTHKQICNRLPRVCQLSIANGNLSDIVS